MTRYFLGFVAWSIAVLVSLCSAQTAQDDQTDDRTGVHVGGRIEGHVWDRATRTPLAGAVIVLGNRRSGTVSDEAGHFTFHVDPGPVTLEITLIGYEPWRSDTLTVIAGTSLRLDIRLAITSLS